MQQKNFCLNLNENGHAKLTSAVGGPKHARHPIGIANPTHHGQLVHVCCWTLMPSFVLSLWLPFWLRWSHKSCTWLTPSPPLLSVNSTSCLENYAFVISILLLDFFSQYLFCLDLRWLFSCWRIETSRLRATIRASRGSWSQSWVQK